MCLGRSLAISLAEEMEYRNISTDVRRYDDYASYAEAIPLPPAEALLLMGLAGVVALRGGPRPPRNASFRLNPASASPTRDRGVRSGAYPSPA